MVKLLLRARDFDMKLEHKIFAQSWLCVLRFQTFKKSNRNKNRDTKVYVNIIFFTHSDSKTSVSFTWPTFEKYYSAS